MWFGKRLAVLLGLMRGATVGRRVSWAVGCEHAATGTVEGHWPLYCRLLLRQGRAQLGARRVDSLRTAFDAYLQLVARKTEGLRAGPQPRGGLIVISKPELELRRIVEESLEQGGEFKRLVRLTRSAFPDDFFSEMSDDVWAERIRRFFRRSGTYSRYLGQPEIDTASSFAAFEGAFKQREMLVRYLAPLELVRFSRDHLDCGSFSIQHFSRERLDGILQTAVHRVFYANADTERLCEYWFLVAEECQPAQGPSCVFHVRDFDDVVSASYQPPPGPVERAVQVLSLFDWERWGGFRLPFVIVTDDNLLRAPCRWWCAGRWAVAPDCSRLLKSGKRAILDEDASSQLENFSRETGSILAQYPETHPWHFFEIAITYFERAFQTEGLDQYLWYMVAIEALVGGEPPEPVLTTIYRRLARMFGSSKKKMKDRFEPLYKLRCDMVHGRALGTAESQAQDAVIGSLPGRSRVLGSAPGARVTEIRQLARQAIRWFAHWLDHVRRTYPPDESLLPKRDQLLSVLDSDERRRPYMDNLQQIENLLQKLPRGFPNVSEWTK